MSGYLLPLLALLILFIGVPWLILHYSSRMRANQMLSSKDEKLLEDLWKSARTLNRRVEALEEILKDKNNKGHKND